MSERNKKSFIRDGLYNIERTMQLDPAAHSKWEVFWLYPHIKAIGYIVLPIGFGCVIIHLLRVG